MTETNRFLVRSFAETVLVAVLLENNAEFVDADGYAGNNSHLEDGLSSLPSTLAEMNGDRRNIHYESVHRVLADGNFVLGTSEGEQGGVHFALYGFFPIANGLNVEPWDTTEAITPHSE